MIIEARGKEMEKRKREKGRKGEREREKREKQTKRAKTERTKRKERGRQRENVPVSKLLLVSGQWARRTPETAEFLVIDCKGVAQPHDNRDFNDWAFYTSG